MATTIRQELIRLALDEKEDKSIAKILAFYYPKLELSDRRKLFESLMYYYRMPMNFDFEKLEKEIGIENYTDKYRNKDYRIKSIEIANLRGIPEQEDYPFGINFFKNGAVNNAIILANNGTGKSSVFAGLEMIFAQEIGEKKLRTYHSGDLESKDFIKYLNRLQSDTQPKCAIETNEGNFDLTNVIFRKKELSLFNPSNHFISDYDIYHYGKLDFSGNADDDKSFHYLLAKTLGLGDFLKFESSLEEIANYSRATESRQLKVIETELKETTKNIDLWESQITDRRQLLDKLKKEKKSISTENLDKDKFVLIKELADKYIAFGIDQDIYQKNIDNFIAQFQKFQSQETDETLSLEKDFLEIGINLLHDVENCPFCKNSINTIDEIQVNTRNRIEELKIRLMNKDELIQSYSLVIEQINNFFQQSRFLYELVEKERSQLGLYDEFGKLSNMEEQIYVQLSLLFANEELISNISKFNTSYPKNKDINSLSRFIIDNQIVIKLTIQSIQNNIQFITERKTIIDNIINELSSPENESSIEKQIGVIEDELIRMEKQIKDAQKRVEVLNKDIEEAKVATDLVQTIKKDVKEFLPKYKLILNSLVQEAFGPVKEMISTIMSDFLSEDKNLTLAIETKDTKKIIDGEEKTESLIVANIQYIDTITGEMKTVSPSHYFNTFRYKLFCLMVSLSLALSTRRKYGINLPLVMDDLFYASDFVSKHRFSKFISKVIELFYKYTPELPLQFILFTHDDLIFRNAIDSLIQYDKTTGLELKKSIIKDTIIGRIFNPQEKDNLEDKPREFANKDLYWDLIYRLPQEILN